MKSLVLLLGLVAPALANPKVEVERTIARQMKGLDLDAKAPAAASKDGYISVLGEFHDDAKPSDQLKDILSHRTHEPVTAKQVKVLSVSRDQRSAIVTFQSPNSVHEGDGSVVRYTFRASELVIKPQADWEVFAGIWSMGVKDADVNQRAKAGEQRAFGPLASKDLGSPELLAAMDTLFTKGFDLTKLHPDLVGIGSAPNEVVPGKVLAPAFNRGWVGKLTVVGGKVATQFGDGDKANTGYGVAHVELAKGSGKAAYKVQFRVWIAFEKHPDGTWLPWHIHFATNDD